MEQLGQALGRLENPRGLLQVSGALLVTNIERRFDSKTDPNGRSWQAMAESSQARFDAEDTQKRGRRKSEVFPTCVGMKRHLCQEPRRVQQAAAVAEGASLATC